MVNLCHMCVLSYSIIPLHCLPGMCAEPSPHLPRSGQEKQEQIQRAHEQTDAGRY